LPRTTVHPGSIYMISKATFPSYFLKDRGIVDQCHTALDLIIFREYVAPALGITHRFVGTEPFCPVTRKYNEDMKRWLMHEPSGAPGVSVIELERKAVCVPTTLITWLTWCRRPPSTCCGPSILIRVRALPPARVKQKVGRSPYK
jgi:citrate lyase synthetase